MSRASGKANAWTNACPMAVDAGCSDEWNCLSTMTDPVAAKLRSVYFAVAKRGRGHGQSDVIVDKTPLNMLHLGFARAIFPDCRFICMSRHPLDVGLSNFGAAFSEAFVSANPFLKDLEQIGHYSRWGWASILDYQKKASHRLSTSVLSKARRKWRERDAQAGRACRVELETPIAYSLRGAQVGSRPLQFLQVRSPIHGPQAGSMESIW